MDAMIKVWASELLVVRMYDRVRINKIPEDENEKDEQGEEGSDVVHGLEHDEQLVAQRRQEAHQLEYAQQTERPQHGQSAGTTLQQLHQAAVRISTKWTGHTYSVRASSPTFRIK